MARRFAAWLLGLGLLLGAGSHCAHAQEEELLPTITAGPAGVEPGMTSLGRSPGAGGSSIENVPGAGDSLLGGRPGPGFPRVPTAITRP